MYIWSNFYDPLSHILKSSFAHFFVSFYIFFSSCTSCSSFCISIEWCERIYCWWWWVLLLMQNLMKLWKQFMAYVCTSLSHEFIVNFSTYNNIQVIQLICTLKIDVKFISVEERKSTKKKICQAPGIIKTMRYIGKRKTYGEENRFVAVLRYLSLSLLSTILCLSYIHI